MKVFEFFVTREWGPWTRPHIEFVTYHQWCCMLTCVLFGGKASLTWPHMSNTSDAWLRRPVTESRDTTVLCPPLPSRQYVSHGVRLEENREDYHNCRVLHWVQQLCSKFTYLYAQFLQAVNDWILSHWDHPLWLDVFAWLLFCYIVHCILYVVLL